MRVLYVSKASSVAAHRDKLSVLARQVELTLLAPERWGRVRYEERREAEPFATVRLRARFHGRNHFHVYAGLGRVLARGLFDLVHVDEEPYSLATLQVAKRARRLGIPALFFAWQNIDKRLPPPFGAVRRAVFRSVQGGIAGTTEARDVLVRNGFAGALAVIPQMGVDPVRFHRDPVARREIRGGLGVAKDTFVVGFMGRLIPEKGVDLLIDALAELPSAHALVIGAGPEKESLRQRADAAGLSGRVYFAGEVASLDAPRWLSAMDCLVLPSRTTLRWKEQFGRVLVEAMACEVPVVGSDAGEIPRVLGEAGFIFPEGRATQLALELEKLAEDAPLRDRLGAAGRARVLSHYTQDEVVTSTLAFYRQLVPASAQDQRRASLESPQLARQGR